MKNVTIDDLISQPTNRQEFEIDLSAGICDNCVIPKIVNTGDGINEPLDPILWCEKTNREICPEPKEERCTSCLFYSPA